MVDLSYTFGSAFQRHGDFIVQLFRSVCLSVCLLIA
jgi:hypothetical protein